MLPFPETFISFCHSCIFDIELKSQNCTLQFCSAPSSLHGEKQNEKLNSFKCLTWELSSSEHLVLYAWPELFPIRSELNRWHTFHFSLNTWAHHSKTTAREPDRSFSKGSSVILKRISVTSLDYLNIQMLVCMDYLWSRWRLWRFSDRWKLKP